MTATFENIYLAENFAPVQAEMTVEDLEVVGQLPEELEGRYLRNGPNPTGVLDSSTHHWFGGLGMVHGVRLRGGRAEWYRNRWVRGARAAEALDEADIAGPPGPLGHNANTNVHGFAGTTWATVEGGALPVELDYELSSLRRNDFFGTLRTGFTAHPKIDPETGEMHAICAAWPVLRDHVEYVVVGTDGRVRRSLNVPLTGMTMLHDMSLTERFAVIFDLPVTVDVELAMAGRFPYRWNPDHGARVGLLPRDGEASDIVWCDVGSCYVYHPVNAYDAPDGSVVIDVCRYERMFDKDINGPAGDTLPTLDRWTIDPVRRTVREERIDERTQEFPRCHPGRVARHYRFGYTAGVGDRYAPGATYKHDLIAGTTSVHDHGLGRGSGEPSFVPRQGATEEDDGWLMSFVYDATKNVSELVVLDAQDLTVAPVARVLLPQRVPFGFHGDFVPDSAVAPRA